MADFLLSDQRRREPEARVPAYVLRSRAWAALCDTSPLAGHIYLVLSSFARRDEAWCSTRTLSRMTGAWRRSVSRALAVLLEQGWIKRRRRSSVDGRRLADLYELRLPGDAGECYRAVAEALNDPQGATATIAHEAWKPGDIYVYRAGIHVRECRLPQSILGSRAFTAMRERGIPWRAYLLLVAYAPDAERRSQRALAAELGVTVSRINEAVRALAEHGFIAVEKVHTSGKARGVDRITMLDVPTAPNVAPDEATLDEVADEMSALEVFGAGAPPADLVALLPEFLRRGEPEMVWTCLESYGLWPRPSQSARPGQPVGARGPALPPAESRHEAATRMVSEFHRAVRGADALPTRREVRVAAAMLEQYESAAWDILRGVVQGYARTRFVPESFLAVRSKVPEHARYRRLPDFRDPLGPV